MKKKLVKISNSLFMKKTKAKKKTNEKIKINLNSSAEFVKIKKEKELFLKENVSYGLRHITIVKIADDPKVLVK